MAQEFGVFNYEGCVEAGFHTLALAEERVDWYRAQGDDEVRAARVCPDHEEQEHAVCEECTAE